MEKIMTGFENRTKLMLQILPYIGLILIVAIFSILTQGAFLSKTNILSLIRQSCIFIIAACGSHFVVSQGNLDISFGGILIISGTVALMAAKVSELLMIPVAIAIAVICELIIGFMHIAAKVPTFIVSMAITNLGRGLATYLLTISGSLSVPKMFKGLGKEPGLFIVTIAAVMITIFISKYTKLGKYNRMFGSNQATAKASGLQITKYKLLAFAMSGLLIGLATVLSVCRSRGINGTSGQGYELNVLIVFVLGGIPLTGGTKVRAEGCVVGAFMLMALESGLTLMGVENSMIGLVKGIIFLITVFLSYDRKSVQIIV